MSPVALGHRSRGLQTVKRVESVDTTSQRYRERENAPDGPQLNLTIGADYGKQETQQTPILTLYKVQLSL